MAFLVGLLGMMVWLAAFGPAESQAADRELNFSLDEGIINLGSTTGVKIIDQSLTPPDNPATLTASLSDDGSLSANASAFTFPKKTIEALETGEPLLPVVDAKIEISAIGGITGTFDDATGVGGIVIPARADITVYSAGQPVSVAKCRVEGFNLDVATSGTLIDPIPDPDVSYDAAPFAPPADSGAVVDTWEGLPASTIQGGGLAGQVCPAVDGLVGGPGGIWLSGTAKIGGAVVPKAPQKQPLITKSPPKTTNVNKADFEFAIGEGEIETVDKFQCRVDSSEDSAWAACDSGKASYTDLKPGTHKFEVRAGNSLGFGPAASFEWTLEGTTVCPEGQTGTPPDCVTKPGKAKLGGLKVKPKSKAVKSGKKATFKVKVKNVGNAAAKGVKVCVKAPKKLVKVKKCAKIGNLAAGNTGTAKFKVTVSKKAKKGKKATLKFKATSNNAGAKSAKAKVKIK